MTEFPKAESFVKRNAVASYFVLTFAISWLGALAVVAPRLLRGEAIPKFAGILMFPVMLLGPVVSGRLLTRIVDGRSGLRELLSRMRRMRVDAQWYAALLIPPAVILIVLLGLKTFVSTVYEPVLRGNLVRNRGGILRRDRLDGLRLPKNGTNGKCAASGHRARSVAPC